MKVNYLEKNKNDFIQDLKKLISIKSILKTKNDYPNLEIKESLKFMEEISKRDGMKSYIDKEGHYGYIEIGKGEEIIGILGHLDVVSEGNIDDWNSNPFELVEKDGKLYGRGTSDDKGPVLLAYYLLKELKDKNLNKRIRLIFGTDEESFWRGIAKYKEKEEIPSIGFTPDSSFPVIFLERELVQYKIIDEDKNYDYEIEAGSAPNVVPNIAKLKLNKEKIIETGISSHAMHPHKGENAIYKLLKNNNLEGNLIKFIKNELNNETNGKTIFEKEIKDDEANLTLNLGILNINNVDNHAIIDLRIPTNTNEKEITNLLKNKTKKYNLKLELFDHLDGVYIPKDSKIIKLMIESYKEITNEEMIPKSTGGATYARSMKNIVAFGPFFETSPDTEHQPNEHVIFDDFIKSYSIYKLLINKFTKSNF